MASSEDINSWAARHNLPSEVTAVLEDNGFSTVGQLPDLSQTDIKEVFQDTGVLKLAHCLALKRALATLSQNLTQTLTLTQTHPTQTLNPGYPHPHPHQEFQADAVVLQPHGPQPQLCYPPQQPGPCPQPYPPPQLQPQGSQHQSQPTARIYPSQHGDAPYDSTTPSRGSGAPPLPQPSVSAGGGHPGPPAAGQSRDYHGMETYRFLLLGKTGSGKSTTGNTIFGAKLFDTAATFASVTGDCERQSSIQGGRKIEIIDSPGLYDTHKTQEEIGVVIVQAVAGIHPGPHAILYVVRLGRYTAEEHGAYKRLKALFDDNITRYMIVVFTHGDMLERDNKSISDLIGPDTPQALQQVLKECDNRYIVFNNVTADPQPQVERLLQMVQEMVRQNGGRPYSCPKYSSIGQGMEEEVARRLQEVEKRDLQRQKYVQQLQQQTKEAEEAARRTQEQCQKNEEERQRRLETEEERRRQLEEELQTQIKERQIGFEKYQQDLSRLHQEQVEQERMMQEKEAQMSEMERKRAEEEAERMRQREQEMQAKLAEQEERMQRQRQEDEERRQQMERQNQELEKEMEEQRRKDREELEQREKEKEKMWMQQSEEDRQAAKRRKEMHEQEMEKLKGQVVAKQATDFVIALASAVHGIARVLAVWGSEEPGKEGAKKSGVRYDDDDDMF